ncbi:MAG: PEGA domain-containing protein [Deltaproteobacteria bacterium]|nr:PEGA domain-containing protein [Deltaproteobacteria bacterium]MBW2160048.1 PEGA domain-containing protein [Deltaproteobacteria bacterium]MBW2214183.1 PEGA domain-containing protein [Deltaproteobacteria bacterium]MBW2380114.1 PEGA domain-containing protein [Deltaproteobacteria bacterium]MBW2586704.1 PEGA domain-containing protein [Deltaproteobacteria bacterium]
MRLVLAVAVLWLCGLPSALAQSEDWLVLPTTADGDVAWMQPTVGKVSREFRKHGVGVWSSGQAAVRFEQRGSAPPSVVAEQAIEDWLVRSQAGIRQLAAGEYSTALSQLEEAQALSNAALEELNRDPKRARTVVDTCLYMVRALLDTGEKAAAEAQAKDCVRMVPGGEPTHYMHPPTVAMLYDEASQPGPGHTSTLAVDSEPSDCALRVNGVLIGKTPFEMTDLYPGEYRAQVECDPSVSSRVHRVQVSPGRTNLFVVTRFDRAVRTTPILHLRYDESPDPRQRARDAREFARELPAAAVVLASVPAINTLELRLIRGTQRGAAFARMETTAVGPSTADVIEATATLLAGECRDFTGPEPVTLDCATGRVETPAQREASKDRVGQVRPPRGQFVSGLTLASVGTASLLTGYGLLAARSSAANDWVADPGSLDAHGKWLSMGTGILVTGAAGSALLVTAMPLVLPYKSKTPWWGWLSGGLGIGFTAAAIAVGVTADPKPAQSCSINNLNPDPCVNRAKQTDLAIMLGVTAAPLLTIPLVYLFRKGDEKLKAELSPSIHVNRAGGAIGVGGAF